MRSSVLPYAMMGVLGMLSGCRWIAGIRDIQPAADGDGIGGGGGHASASSRASASATGGGNASVVASASASSGTGGTGGGCPNGCVLMTATGVMPTGLAIDEDTLYWTEYAAGRV